MKTDEEAKYRFELIKKAYEAGKTHFDFKSSP